MSVSLVFLLAVGTFAGAEPIAGKVVPSSRDLVNDLAAFIEKHPSSAAKDVDRELQRLLQDLVGARSSVSARKLVEERPADAAVLLFVLGTPGYQPGWIGGSELAAALSARDTERRGKLLKLLQPWRSRLNRGGTREKSVFLDEAVRGSFEVLRAGNLRKELGSGLARSLGEPEDASVSGAESGAADNDPAQGFSWESLYERGGVVMDLSVPGESVKRRISMKIYTGVDEKGALVDKIGIFDITYPNESFGRRFDLGQGGEKTEILDTRNPQSPKYTLKMEPTATGDMQIVFGREGLKGPAIKTSLNKLYRLRAQQAVDEGGKITIGKSDFIVLGQGGANGALLFFPADIQERLSKGENVKPQLAALVNQRSSDGRNVPIGEKAALGFIDDKGYHLAFNGKKQYWEVKEGVYTPPSDSRSSTSTPKMDGAGLSDLAAECRVEGETLCVTDDDLLGEAMSRVGFTSDEIRAAYKNLSLAFEEVRNTLGWETGEYRIEGDKKNSGLKLLLVKNKKKFSVWPQYKSS